MGAYGRGGLMLGSGLFRSPPALACVRRPVGYPAVCPGEHTSNAPADRCGAHIRAVSRGFSGQGAAHAFLSLSAFFPALDSVALFHLAVVGGQVLFARACLCAARTRLPVRKQPHEISLNTALRVSNTLVACSSEMISGG